MTLIIGAKCHDGVVLVSDKKIFDLESGENIYSEKLFFPIPGFSIVVGAAGLTNLFREFNSKLPLVVQERLTEYRIRNICELEKIGEKIEDYEVPSPKPTEFQSADVVPQKEEKIVKEKKRKLASLPYNYSVPAFLDDCRTLIQQICERDESAGLDVLIGVYAPGSPPHLYHIDYRGKMSEVEFYSIGSGSPYVNLFRSKWNSTLDIPTTTRLFCYMIRFIEKLDLDRFVGLDGAAPDAKLILNDGRPFIFTLPAEEKALTDTTYIEKFKKIVSDLEL